MLNLLLWVAMLAQTPPLNYSTQRCSSVVAGRTYFIVQGQVSYQTCIAIGDMFKLVTVNGQATLQIDTTKLPVSPPAKVLRQTMRKVPLEGLNTTTVTVVLPYTPADDTLLTVIYQSKTAGFSVVDMVPIQTDLDKRVVELLLPDHRPFTAQDYVTIGYWTYDPK